MSITPLDIQNKEFERSFRGYDIEDVDEFLDRVGKDLEGIMRENSELREQLAEQLEKNKNYNRMEETMHNAIVVAQETAEEVKHNAKREAELIRREAMQEAHGLIAEARQRRGKILDGHEELYKQAQVFKVRFRSFIEAQLAALESEDFFDRRASQEKEEEVSSAAEGAGTDAFPPLPESEDEIDFSPPHEEPSYGEQDRDPEF